MNALPPMDPAAIGRSMRDGRAYQRHAGAKIGRDLVSGRAVHKRIGPKPINWTVLIARAVIVAGVIVSTVACVTQ